MNMWYRVVRMMLYSMRRGKAIPLQAWTDPLGSRRLRVPKLLQTIGT